MTNGDESRRHFPENGPLVIDHVVLSAGRRISATVGSFGGPQFDAMWMTDRSQNNAGAAWWALRNHENLRPILLDGLDVNTQLGERRTWDTELIVLDSIPSGPGSVYGTIKKLWDAKRDPDTVEWTSPFTEFPGLASAGSPKLSDAELERAVGLAPDTWLGLVPVTRAADIPSSIGWFFSSEAFGQLGLLSPSSFTEVLRSWEERFGAIVFRLGFATLQLLVSRPPTNIEDATALAAELFGVASEFQSTEGIAVDSVHQIAEFVLGSPWWTFWWD
jgi:hypothetical protein